MFQKRIPQLPLPAFTRRHSNDLPAFACALPTAPLISLDGRHDVPYLNAALGVARPSAWPYSAWLWRLVAVGLLLPGFLICYGLLTLWHVRREVTITGIAGYLQQAAFFLTTLFEEESYPGAEQVGVMFPDQVVAWPVDVGIVEAVILLNAAGATTVASCAGHGGRPYVELAEHREFPASLLEALAARQVPFLLQPEAEDRGPVLTVRTLEDSAGFLQCLMDWACEQAPLLVGDVSASIA